MNMSYFNSFEELFSFLHLQFATIRWTDILDILLLAVLFYYSYRFISERRASKLAIGILLIAGVLVLANFGL